MQASDVDSLTKDLAQFLKLMLVETGRDFFKEMEALSMSMTQMKTLGTLIHADEPLGLGALSETLGVSLPAVSRAVEDLRERGFVKREEDARDRRSKVVAITGKGRHAFDRLLAARLAGTRRFLEGLDEEQREALSRGLEPILRRKA